MTRGIPGLKTFIKTKKKEIKQKVDDLSALTSNTNANKLVAQESKQKWKYIEERKAATGKLEKIYRTILDLYSQIDGLNKQKASIAIRFIVEFKFLLFQMVTW
ncbi:hypothetical protein BC941DRAFT_475930 [Chlamydoabsidia padenii]|nr:hypothetical protein BC941DRAFT_475930 [Chlamydoabsidia padenii]